MTHRHRVVVVGAGFAGMAAAKGLADAPVEVLIVDANNFHTFQPLLYQVATAGLNADDVAHPIRGTFRRQPNVDVLVGRVTGVDLEAREIVVDGTNRIGYDHLVLACGAVSASFGVPGVDDHTLALKDLGDALAIRSRVLQAFERAAAGAALGSVDTTLMTVAIVGGGPTGVELAGGLSELFAKVLAKDFKSLDLRRARVVLLEGTDRLLGSFAPELSRKAASTLQAKGVEVELGTSVEKIEDGVVQLVDGRRIEAATIVWAAGVRANPLAAELGVETTRGGRIVVHDDLTLPGHPEVFVAGDVAATPAGGGALLPQVSQPAIQGGAHAAAVISARLGSAGEAPKAFRYRDRGSAATIGRHAAVFEFPRGLKLSGPIGWFAWLGLHLVYLVGFRNKARVLVSWWWEYVTWERGNRIVGADIDG